MIISVYQDTLGTNIQGKQHSKSRLLPFCCAVAELGVDSSPGFDLLYFDMKERAEKPYAADVRGYELRSMLVCLSVRFKLGGRLILSAR
jgi:hypothetical protein